MEPDIAIPKFKQRKWSPTGPMSGACGTGGPACAVPQQEPGQPAARGAGCSQEEVRAEESVEWGLEGLGGKAVGFPRMSSTLTASPRQGAPSPPRDSEQAGPGVSRCFSLHLSLLTWEALNPQNSEGLALCLSVESIKGSRSQARASCSLQASRYREVQKR